MPASPIIEIKEPQRRIRQPDRTARYKPHRLRPGFSGYHRSQRWWKDYPYQMYTGTAETHLPGRYLYHSCPPSPSEIASCQLINCQLSIIHGLLCLSTAASTGNFPSPSEEVILSGLSSKKPLASRFTARTPRESLMPVIARMGLEGTGSSVPSAH